MTDYRSFLAAKSQRPAGHGFAPLWLPAALHGFQAAADDWAIRRGRAAIIADCGLGKTPMLAVWAENMVRKTNRPALVVTVLGDSAQTVAECHKFGVEAVRVKDGRVPAGARVVVTNYESLHKFDPADFAAAVYNESSILKNYKGKRKAVATEFMRTIPYRLLCTATMAPNDYTEIGTSSEALGELGHMDMLSKFFKNEKGTNQAQRLFCHEARWRFRGHAETPFWRWVCSWAKAFRKPSDLGFDDGPFVLPPLEMREHVAGEPLPPRPGEMFAEATAMTLEEQRAERRRTLPERCDRVAELVGPTGEPAVCWVHLNGEGARLVKLIPGAVEVSGADADEAKEEIFEAFKAKQIRVLVTKPTIAGYGLNWQHCAHATFFPSHSFEQWYQCVRRCWRFGQARPVRVDEVTGPGEAGVLANRKRKAAAADRMYARLVAMMNNPDAIVRHNPYVTGTEAPSWLSSNKT